MCSEKEMKTHVCSPVAGIEGQTELAYLLGKQHSSDIKRMEEYRRIDGQHKG
jgi:hypothetical protein